jgi:RHS repeat-associated protein
MKKLISLIIFETAMQVLPAQTDHNYVITTTPLVEVETISELDALSHQDKIQQIQYIDAFGRVELSMQIKESPLGRNIIQPFQYDAHGRLEKSYLPYSANSANELAYPFNWPQDQANFYSGGANHVSSSAQPFGEIEYWKSSLNKIRRSGAPGDDWSLQSSHVVTNLDGTCTGPEDILIWKLDENSIPVIDEIEYIDASNIPVLIETQDFDENNSVNWQFSEADLFDGTNHVFQITSEYPESPLTYSGLIENVNYKIRISYSRYSQTYAPGFFCISFYNNGIVVDADNPSGGESGNYVFEIQSITGVTDFTITKCGPDGNDNDLIQIDQIEILSYGSPATTNYYPRGFLYKKSVSDEQGNIEENYYDFAGRLILNRQFANGIPLDTYNVYDAMGRERYIIPPAASQLVATNLNFDYAQIAEYVFEKVYDGRNRVIEEKTPGKEETHFVYDDLDHIILEQDGNLRGENKWLFYKYDLHSRSIMTGIYTPVIPQTRSELQASYSLWWQNNPGKAYETFVGTGDYFGYTLDTYPSSGGDFDVMTVNYFDSYGFISDPSMMPDTDNMELFFMDNTGLPTGSIVKVLDGGNTYLSSVSYYDNKKRNVQMIEQTLNGSDVLFASYNWIGDVVLAKRKHTWNGNGLSIQNRYEYDHARRLKKCFQKTGLDDEITLFTLEYNELEQVVKKRLHKDPTASNYLQTVDYRYNIRGWLEKINNAELVDDNDNLEDDDVFGEELIYNGTVNTSQPFAPQYNGNIAAMKWKSKAPNIDGTTIETKLYTFEYDHANRLKAARSATNTIGFSTSFDANVDQYNELMSYDRNGNMLTMERYNGGQGVDNLIYDYEPGSNRINYIHDQWNWPQQEAYKHFPSGVILADEYDYDNNGNMTVDQNKGITLSYNHLNLVAMVHKDGFPNIEYTYDASGRKLVKQVGYITEYYVGGIEYFGNELKQITHAEGAVRPTPPDADNETEYVYDYLIKDHLQNVRVIITNANAVHEEVYLTQELERKNIEESQFENVPPVRDNKPAIMPSTSANPNNFMVSELTTENGNEMGPGKVLTVQQGDAINFMTDYWYNEIEPNNTAQTITEILSAMIGGLLLQGSNIIPPGEAGLGAFTNTGSAGYGSLVQFVTDNFDGLDMSRPQAYLVYISLDHKMRVDASGSGALRVEDEDVLATIEKIDLTAQQDGYVYIYLLNGSSQKVYFDDFRIIRQRANVLAQMDYYPYGLQWSNPSTENTRNKYWHTNKEMQDKEWSDTEGLDWEDFGARMYDPVIGRWTCVDNLSNEFLSKSPYHFAKNNPVSHIDLDGNYGFYFQGASAQELFKGMQSGAISGRDLMDMIPDELSIQETSQVEVDQITETFEYHGETKAGHLSRFHLVVTYSHLFYVTTKEYKISVMVNGVITVLSAQKVQKDMGYQISKDNTYAYFTGMNIGGWSADFYNTKAATKTNWIEDTGYEFQDFKLKDFANAGVSFDVQFTFGLDLGPLPTSWTTDVETWVFYFDLNNGKLKQNHYANNYTLPNRRLGGWTWPVWVESSKLLNTNKQVKVINKWFNEAE